MFRLIIFTYLLQFSVGEVIHGRILLNNDASKLVRLPSQCTLIVQLQDTSLADTPATILKQVEASHLVAFPIYYQIEIPTDISPALSYSLSARITKDNTLLYINDQHVSVTVEADSSIAIDIPVINVNREPTVQEVFDEMKILSWSEMLGKEGNYAVEYIKEQSGLTNVFTVTEKTPVSMDYQIDRVRVFVGQDGIVNQVPYNG